MSLGPIQTIKSWDGVGFSLLAPLKKLAPVSRALLAPYDILRSAISIGI